MHVQFLLEERSAREVLGPLLSRMLPESCSFDFDVYRGKQDLLSRLRGDLKAYRKGRHADLRIVVLIDQDRQDCHDLKRQLESAASTAGFSTRQSPDRLGAFQLLNRVAIEEIGAWFFGDQAALRKAYPRVKQDLDRKKPFRNPDAIPGGTAERLLGVLQQAGYYRNQRLLPKIEVARRISPHMDPAQNRSHSFQVFREGLLKLVQGDQMEVEREWYRRSFDALYPIVYAHRTVKAAGPEAHFAIEQLYLKSGERLLDLCCGNGRHMAHLIRCTRNATGLDYSPELLDHARALLGPAGELVRADMRAIPFGEVFDVVTNFFTSFGYFATDEENACVVREVARVLKPGGRFFIDYLNAVHVEKTLVPESVREYNAYRIEERRWIDAACRRVNKVMTVWRAGQRLGEWGESVRLYDEQELRALLAAASLRVDRVFGGYSGGPVSPDSSRMILVGHRG